MTQKRYFPTTLIALLAMSISQSGYCYDPTHQATVMEPSDVHPKSIEGAEDNQSRHKRNKEDQVRLKINQLLQASQDLVKAKKYEEALAKLTELEGATGKTETDAFLIERTRVVIAYETNDQPLLIKSLEAVLASGQLPAAEKMNFTWELATSYYRQKNYPKAITWLTRYFSDGGTDKDLRGYLIRSYYLNNDFVHAGQEVRADIQAAEAAGKAPSEEELRMSVNCALKLHDDAAYTSATEKLVAYYPKKQQWVELLTRLIQQPGFSDRLMMDVYRLMLVTDQITTSKDFISMSELAMQSGYPFEAKKVLNLGLQSGVLGTGAEASKHQKLLGQAEKSADARLKNAGKDEAALIKSKNYDALVDLGYTYVAAGKFDKGISLMEQGIRAGSLRQPEEATLHLGIAYVLAGRKSDAVQTFKSVQGTDGAADIARYWMLHLNHVS